MRVIMSGGGTGGHIYPAIAIADEIKRRHPEAEILFVGTEHGMEREIVPKSGYPIKFITVRGFDRKHLLRNIDTIKELNKGIHEARKIIADFKPDYVIGTGGYVCGPVVRSAYRAGIPSYIHEQNAFPGLTNKLLSRHVDRVFLAFDDAKSYFKCKNEPVTVGNPVRSAFTETSREESRRALGIKDGEFVILGFGGSLGAKKINDEMEIAAERFAGKEGVRVIWATGKRYYKEIMAAEHPEAENIKYMEYINDMPRYLRACDLVVSRSGALTVSEITACGRPSIMIPSPYVTNNHQYYNAMVVADRGGAVVIEEKNLASGQVAETAASLEADPEKLELMAHMAESLGRTDAASVICDTIGIKEAEQDESAE
ncbi:MAG: undecaprenyldiphospho-muramoylpentapeptide beta-N-acetylglucosaminyltransferase [Eubacteriales bacterium]|jgi:UDP-N-acetylglucosamine--N-acetylmuramyl-(pentapeptide) pyrophosphoryl-undecaprenol N-acetylglucosamine transferase|nr:undecaprenyldiphospho-muramoylpentapeptide beta-N-acetylglucosaminyltransferase [Eubacteriales bacterium]